MPREPRKSSLGTRRGPPRQHIPFRADDLARGKKTGIAVQYVDRNSDEFEPFAEVMKQADNRTPPRIKSKKRRISVATPVRDQEVDEDGEMSMELAESNQGTPLVYFTDPNRGYPHSSTVRRAAFEQAPSPHSRPSALSSRVDGAGPSSPGQSATPPDIEPDFEPFDPSVYEEEHERPGDEQDAEDNEMDRPTKRLDKGKRRAIEDDEQLQVNGMDDEVEDIVRGVEDVENGNEEDEEVPSTKKVEEKPKKPRARPAKRVVLPAPERSPTPEGVRRGRRHRYRPLEWWRQEKVVYGRRESGLTLVPHIKEIVRIPKEPPQPLGKVGKRKRGGSARAKSKTRQTETPAPINPEEGWDDNTPSEGIVLDFLTQETVKRRVVQTAKMFQPKSAANSSWFFQKIFGEGDFIAAGEMLIPPDGKKPSKSSKDNAYVFYVIEGAVSVVIHETKYTVATGGMFLVPRGLCMSSLDISIT
ncbi:hypothetical protein ID866_2163 [Astraeus odoratus]|nr:hypothetical protein ID866_2163 [Astraeus odoratus]